MRNLLIATILLAAASAVAEKPQYSRYEPIVIRQMFGPLPPGFDPTKSPNDVQKAPTAEDRVLAQEQAKLQSAIHFSMINLTPDGKTAVGFTDNSDPKAPVNYYLKVGESRNGWTVKEADAQKAEMTIVKGEIEVTLSIGGNSANGTGTSRAGGAAPTAAANGGAQTMRPFGGGYLGGHKTIRERRLQRQQELAAAEVKQREEQAARDAERQARDEQEKQQREAERAEHRQQLLAIQEELKRVREAKSATEKNRNEGSANNEAE